MPTPQNLLEQLVMQMRQPVGPDAPAAPRPQSNTPIEDEVLATLLSQALEPGERVPPANVIRPQLAADLGITEEDLTLNLMGSQNLIQTGAAPAGSLLGTVAQDRGLDTESMRQIVRGNASLANADAGAQEDAAQGRQEAVRQSQNPQGPTSDSILEGLLAEARGVTERADPDAEAAFQNKLARMMRSPNASSEERKAAYQLRHPEMTVEVQEDGVMSFSDKGPGLQVKDEKTRRAVDNVKARLETLSPDQPIVAGEGTEVESLAASTKQRIADNVTSTRTTLFGASPSKAVSDIQSELESVVSIQDPNERAIALQRMGPSITAYGNQRRAELRNEVFRDMGVAELERSLALQQARDKADPRWDEFRRDSPKTASVHAQLRQARQDALQMVERRVQSDPMLNTLQSQTAMTEAIVKQQNKTDSSLQLSDHVTKLSPQGQKRVQTAVQALHPDKDVSDLGSPDLAKIYGVDETFYAAIAAVDTPSKAVSMIVTDPTNSNKWKSYLKQAELGAGADDYTAERLANTYTKAANDASRALTGGMDEKELVSQGREVQAIVEQWDTEKSSLSPTEFAQRRDNYYVPRIVEAKLGYIQQVEADRADKTYTNLQPITGSDVANELIKQAKNAGYSLGDLMDPHKMSKLEGTSLTPIASAEPNAPNSFSPGSWEKTGERGRLTVFADPEVRNALAQYVSMTRKENMLKTAFMEPIDTARAVERKLQVASVTSLGMPQ